jgi:hypothetical protein
MEELPIITQALPTRFCAPTDNFSEIKTKTPSRSWLNRLKTWLSVKKLERDLRESKKFQRLCERIGCPILAESEKNYQAILLQKICDRKQHQQTISPSTLQTLNLQNKK